TDLAELLICKVRRTSHLQLLPVSPLTNHSVPPYARSYPSLQSARESNTAFFAMFNFSEVNFLYDLPRRKPAGFFALQPLLEICLKCLYCLRRSSEATLTGPER